MPQQSYEELLMSQPYVEIGYLLVEVSLYDSVYLNDGRKGLLARMYPNTTPGFIMSIVPVTKGLNAEVPNEPTL